MSDVPPVEADPGSTARFIVHEHHATMHHATMHHLDLVDDAPGGSRRPRRPGSQVDLGQGTYTVVRETPDKLVSDLDGRRGSARYALIHTGADNWLVHLKA